MKRTVARVDRGAGNEPGEPEFCSEGTGSSWGKVQRKSGNGGGVRRRARGHPVAPWCSGQRALCRRDSAPHPPPDGPRRPPAASPPPSPRAASPRAPSLAGRWSRGAGRERGAQAARGGRGGRAMARARAAGARGRPGRCGLGGRCGRRARCWPAPRGPRAGCWRPRCCSARTRASPPSAAPTRRAGASWPRW